MKGHWFARGIAYLLVLSLVLGLHLVAPAAPATTLGPLVSPNGMTWTG
jgi:hypothetical protein